MRRPASCRSALSVRRRPQPRRHEPRLPPARRLYNTTRRLGQALTPHCAPGARSIRRKAGTRLPFYGGRPTGAQAPCKSRVWPSVPPAPRGAGSGACRAEQGARRARGGHAKRPAPRLCVLAWCVSLLTSCDPLEALWARAPRHTRIMGRATGPRTTGGVVEGRRGCHRRPRAAARRAPADCVNNQLNLLLVWNVTVETISSRTSTELLEMATTVSW